MDNTADVESDNGFEDILRFVKETRGFDFTGYKRSSLRRRVDRRMAQIEVEGYSDYMDQLQANTDEFVALFNTILVNVTGFLRDPDAWDYLRTDVLPTVLAERGPDEPLRVWSAGCASGEEAYSLAIVLAETLGADDFRRRVKIYATDIDEEALAQARHAVYTDKETQGLDEDLLRRYFEPRAGRYAFRQDLRRSVIFGRNDLVQDAPISRIDLLVCRNTLMYFNAETQTKVLDKLHFALGPSGLLFLGKAEMLLNYGRIFDPLDLKRRVFRKVATRTDTSALFMRSVAHERRTAVGLVEEMRRLAFAASPVAQLVIAADDVLALANQQAQQLFSLTDRDIGRPLRDLEVSYRPVELRGYVDQVRNERRSLRIKDVEWRRGPGEVFALEVHLNPLYADETVAVSVAFHDVTANRRLHVELNRANRRRESAYEELQSTNEELETTNEELQSTVEELETTNEELQSTNEELETTNEELQSTNDELQTINNELRERTSELDEVNEFLESIMSSWRAGVIVLDQSMRVVVWNVGAEELWGLRREEVEGEHLLNLDIGLPVAELRPIVRPALTDPAYSTELRLEAVNRRGRHLTMRVVCTALRGRGDVSTGAILVMEAVEPDTDRDGAEVDPGADLARPAHDG